MDLAAAVVFWHPSERLGTQNRVFQAKK